MAAMTRRLDADYLVVGAGAAGMAFADAVTRHADVRVALVDRRPAPGGHWLDAYPFVRLHQASAFYGVASTVLGTGSIQRDGPEAGLHERAGAPEVCAYFQRVLEDLVASGRVTFHPGCEYLGDGAVVSRISGTRHQAGADCRIVDARYLAPEIPATTPPPFRVAEGARVVPVGELPAVDIAPPEFVIVGSGKTATDTCVWLLGRGVDPDAICWVRPRAVERGRIALEQGDVAIHPDAVVVHCAAAGLQYPPLVPIWGADAITIQPVRAGFPCFGAALVGYVEATREDDREKNRLCPPSPLSDTPADWALMQTLGTRASMSFGSEPDIKAWADTVALNPAAIPPGRPVEGDLAAAVARLRAAVEPGVAALAALAGLKP